MGFTTCSVTTSYISGLADLPNDTGGLSASQLKAKYDQAGTDLKNYLNNTLIPQMESTTDGSSGADRIGATQITGLSGDSVQELLESIAALGVGTMPGSGTVTDQMLSNAANQIKDRLSAHLADYTKHLRPVTDFGVKGNGVEEATAIQNAINAAMTAGISLFFPKPSVSYKINTGISVDLSKTSILGDCSLFDCSEMTTGYAIQVYSSASSVELRRSNFTHKVKGFTFVGNKTAGVHGLKYGHAIYDANNDLLIEDCTFTKFDRLIEFAQNAWRSYFKRCYFNDALNYIIYAPNSVSANSGEVMQFDHCQFHGNDKPAQIEFGQWDFNGCSLLNAQIVIDVGTALVNWNGGNIENPGAGATVGGYKMVRVLGNSCVFVVNGGRLSINPDIAFNQSPFECNAANGGIIINSMSISASSNMSFDVNDTLRLYVKGTGRVFARGVTFPANFGSNFHVPISKHLNVIRNGDAETGNTNSWTVGAYGVGGSTAVSDATSKKNGSYGFKLTSVAGGGVNMDQFFDLMPGGVILIGCFARAVSGTCFIQLRQYDKEDNEISAAGFTPSSSYLWDGFALCSLVVPKAVKAKLTLNAQVGGQMFVDDIYVNVV